MGDPIGAASQALKSLKPDGTVMVGDLFANKTINIFSLITVKELENLALSIYWKRISIYWKRREGVD
jgi:hypothetical protein